MIQDPQSWVFPLHYSQHRNWQTWLDSNQQRPGVKVQYTSNRMSRLLYLVQGLGIEPSSYALQAYAGITRLAHPAKFFGY